MTIRDVIAQNMATEQEICLISLLNLEPALKLSVDTYISGPVNPAIIAFWGMHRFIISDGFIYGYNKNRLTF